MKRAQFQIDDDYPSSVKGHTCIKGAKIFARQLRIKVPFPLEPLSSLLKSDPTGLSAVAWRH